MEVGQTLDAPEMAVQDLLEVLGDREVSMFGVTGTLTDLAKLCPVDLNDARVTLEAKNEFVVKAANEAGLEIDAAYETVFSRVIEQKGLERKFTVAKTEKTIEVQPEAPLKQSQPADKPSSRVVLARPEAAQGKATVDVERVQEQQRIAGMVALHELTQARAMAEVIAEQTGSSPQASVLLPKPATRPVLNNAVELSTNDSLTVAKVSPVELPAVMSAYNNTVVVLLEAARGEALPALVEGFDVPVPSQEVLPLSQPEGLRLAWEAELQTEPQVIYDDFAEGLAVFMLNFAEVAEPTAFGNETELEACPPIVVSVIEQLAQADETEKEQVALVLQQIVGAIHGMHVLEADSADPEVAERVKIQLEALCEELFTALGLEYNERTVSDFIKVILSQEFKPEVPMKEEAPQLNLENIGTHEAKYLKGLLRSSLARTSQRLEHVLGVLVLIYAHPLSSK